MTVGALSERCRHGLHMHRGDRSVLGGQILGSGTGAPDRHHVGPGIILKWGVLYDAV